MGYMVFGWDIFMISRNGLPHIVSYHLLSMLYIYIYHHFESTISMLISTSPWSGFWGDHPLPRDGLAAPWHPHGLDLCRRRQRISGRDAACPGGFL